MQFKAYIGNKKKTFCLEKIFEGKKVVFRKNVWEQKMICLQKMFEEKKMI